MRHTTTARHGTKLAMLLAAIAALLPWLTACNMFDYHPYDARFGGETHINATQIAQIEQATQSLDTLRFAVISDSHLSYSQTKDVIAQINARNDIQFVIHCGDITDNGTTREYEQIRSLLATLAHPYVVVMGNHDCLGTGMKCFQSMFGDTNFSFTAGNVKFVCIDTNALEYDYVAPVPNFDFMERQASNMGHATKTVIVMHAPPGDEVFNNNVKTAFAYYTHLFPGLQFCLYGHRHIFEERSFYNDGVHYYCTPATAERSYLVFTIYPHRYEYEKIG